MKKSCSILTFHFDFNFVSLRPDYIRHWLKKVADMGYNSVLWEIENKVQWENCPECVWPEAMTKPQFREILAYSRDLGLEPIPLLQTIGHGEYVLMHKPYHAFRELPTHHDCYCTSKPEVRKFLTRWVTEYLDLFGPLKYFHLGGDEAYVFGKCPECSARIAATSANTLYAEHVSEIAKPLLQAGIRPGVWGDMLLAYPKDVNCLPSQFVVWDWNYWDGCRAPEKTLIWHRHGRYTKAQVMENNVHKEIAELLDDNGDIRPFHTVDILRNTGHDVIVCSSSRCYTDSYFVPRHDVHVDNVAGAALKARTAEILGTCVTSWGLRLNSYETQEPVLRLAPAVMSSPEPVKSVISKVIPESLHQHLTDIAVFDTTQMRLSGIQWRSFKDSVPAPAGHTAASVADLQATKSPFWADRVKILENALASVQRGLRGLSEHKPAQSAWLEAGRLQERYYQALLLLFGRQPDCAQAISALTSLRADFAAYLKKAQTPISANQNAGHVFDPLLEYANAMNESAGVTPALSAT